MRRTGCSELVADLTAEVFAAAYLAAPRFREGPEPAGAWLLGVARNKLLRSLRQDRAEFSALRRLAIERIAVSDESLMALEEFRECGVLELLEGLPEDHREAVRARIIDELSYDQLAAVAHVSGDVARKRVSRGLAALRHRLNNEGDG
jgi:RNA polymerase sigma-70 factor (ECF subfamily)